MERRQLRASGLLVAGLCGVGLLALCSLQLSSGAHQDVELYQRTLPGLRIWKGPMLSGQGVLGEKVCEELMESGKMTELCPECNCGCCQKEESKAADKAEDVRAYYFGTNPSVTVHGDPGIAMEPADGSGAVPVKGADEVTIVPMDGTSHVDPLEWYKMEYRNNPHLSKYWDKSPFADESFLLPAEYTIYGAPPEQLDPEEFEAAVKMINAEVAAEPEESRSVEFVQPEPEKMTEEEMEEQIKEYAAKIEEIEATKAAMGTPEEAPEEVDDNDGGWDENAPVDLQSEVQEVKSPMKKSTAPTHPKALGVQQWGADGEPLSEPTPVTFNA